MRKVTKEVCLAFLEGKSKSVGNTFTDGESLWLHGNKIAWYVDASRKMIYITDCGWPTVMTKERLNGLLRLAGSNVYVYTKKHKLRITMSYGNIEWSGKPIAILNFYEKG